MKVPTYVSEEWAQRLKQPGAVLGHLDISKGVDRTMKLDVASSNPDFPRECKVEIRTKQTPMVLFAHAPNTNTDPRFLAGVDLSADAIPIDSATYRNYLQNRMQLSFVKTQTVKHLSEADSGGSGGTGIASGKGAVSANVLQPQVDAMAEQVKAQQRREKEARQKPKAHRARLPKAEVEAKLLQLFDEQQFWSIKELLNRTEQPKAHLKEFLDAMCNQHRSGEHVHEYSLKPEWQVRAGATDVQADDSDDTTMSAVKSEPTVKQERRP
jgi:transcription initiation factor TFIIF subunit beta